VNFQFNDSEPAQDRRFLRVIERAEGTPIDLETQKGISPVGTTERGYSMSSLTGLRLCVA